MWDLAGARCRFGKYLRVEVNGSVPPVAEVLRDFPSRRSQTEHGELPEGLRVRLQLQRREAIGELDLGDAVRFYPSDGALERWQTGCARAGSPSSTSDVLRRVPTPPASTAGERRTLTYDRARRPPADPARR